MMWIDQDFDQFYSTKYKFDTLEDFRNARIVTWYGPQEKAMLQALGASPIPMDVTEIPTAKRTGAIDTNIAPSIWQVGSQLYTVDKYVNTMKIRYSPAVIIISNQAFDSVPASITGRLYDEREAVQDKFVVETRKDNQRCLKAMLDYGVQEVRVPADQMADLVNRGGVRHEGQTQGRLFGRQFGPGFEEKNGRTRPVILDLKADADHNPVRTGYPLFSVPFKSKTPARGGSGYFLDPGIQSGSPCVPLASDRPDGEPPP